MAVSRPERLAGGRANILYGTIADSRTTKTKRQARDGSGNWLLCLLSLIMLLSSQQVVASLNQELTSGGERQQQQQQQQQPLQSATIIPLESVASNDDLDGENSSNGNNNSNMTSNSIRDNNLIPKHQQHQRNWKSSNSIAAPTGPPVEQSNENNLLVDNSILERRLDRLEFELRKSLHQIRLSTVASGSSPSATAANQVEQVEAKYSSLVSRLELLEKFIATTTKKLYETEQRVKQLEKCECRLSCKWTPSPMASSVQQQHEESMAHNNNNNRRPQVALRHRKLVHGGETLPSVVMSSDPADGDHDLASGGSSISSPETSTSNNKLAPPESMANFTTKADGESWKNNCDVCSCHRGRVKCRHMSCPPLSCSDPRHVPDKCCPVCYKTCIYKEQRVGHGNKLVINSNQDTCKECLCIDGRLRCQRVELDKRFEATAVASGGGGSSRQQRSTLLLDLNDSMEQDERRGPEESDDDRRDSRFRLNRRDHLYANSYASGARGMSNDNDNDLESLYNANDLYEDFNPMQRKPRGATSQQIDQSNGGASGLGNDLFHVPLVCPPINCPASEQLRLKNDCCTYCKRFDFCSHASFKGVCHPDATCVNLNLNSSSEFNLTKDEQLSKGVGAMFTCKCKPGFAGDGKFCRDIDECSDRKLNDCDAKTTTCVNLPGSYECHCKRGYKPQLDNQISNSLNINTAVDIDDDQKTGLNATLKVRKCQDINECLDGKLNRCDPQAKCINLRGSYKCRCRRGYLGNGLECHQWFSSDPNVAAYLYRHSSSSSSSSSGSSSLGPTSASGWSNPSQNTASQRSPAASTTAINPISGASQTKLLVSGGASGGGGGIETTKINLPLDSLDDPDDDRIDRVVERYEFVSSNDEQHQDGNSNDNNDLEEDGDYGEDDDSDKASSLQTGRIGDRKSNLIASGRRDEPISLGNRDQDGDQDDDGETASSGERISNHAHSLTVPKLSESQWQPLKFGDWPSLFGGSGSSEPQQQQQQQQSNQVTTRTNEQASGSNNNRHETYDEQRDSLNTRTMFFQPPPSYRRPTQPPKSQEAASNKQLDSTTSPHQTTTNTNYVTEGGGGESKPTDSNRRQQQQPPGDKSDTNEPVLFGTAAKTNGLDQQPPARQESSFAFQQTSSSASPLSAPPATLSNSYNGQGHRRGTIIASATTSPSRGHYNVRMAHSSSLQNHKPKVSSSSSSPAYRLWSPNDLWWLVSTSLYAVVVMIIMMEESRVTQTASDLLH